MQPLPASFLVTRQSAHALTEHVLCAVRYAAVGRVGVLPGTDGIVTPAFDGRVVGLVGVELVDSGPAGERRAPVTTLRAAGAFFGIDPGAPALWSPTTPAELDEPLVMTAEAVDALAAWFDLVTNTLAQMHPSATQTLWPEHFDLAITVSDAVAGDITYGGSAGDAAHDDPYLYVLPPTAAPDGDRSFWNEPFGASLSYGDIGGAAEAMSFYVGATERIGRGTPAAGRG